MPRQYFHESLRVSQAAGTSVSNTTVATSVIPTADKITLPNCFLDPGRALRFTVTGQISNVVTTPGTFTPDIRLASVVAFNGGALQMSTTAHTALPVMYDILLTARAQGSATAGNAIGCGRAMGQPFSFTNNADLATSNSVGSFVFPTTTPAVGTGYDSTAALTVDHFVTFSVSTAGTNYQLQQFVIESLN